MTVSHMTQQIIGYLLTCGPLVLMLAAWAKLFWTRAPWPVPVALIALSIVSANAVIAAANFLYYSFKPPPPLPPWKDPETLNLGLLFLLAPIGAVMGFVAGARGAPKWLVGILEMASVPLILVGFLEAVSV